MLINVSLGLDPELLVVDDDGYIVPAEKFLTGDKKAWVAYDNAAIELRPAPCYCAAGLSGNTRELLWDAIAKMRLARRKGIIPKGSSIITSPAAPVRREDMMLESVSMFGCSEAIRLEADGSINSVKPNPGAESIPFRSAGYHVHVATQLEKTTRSLLIPTREGFIEWLVPRIKVLDALVGLVDVMMVSRDGDEELSQIRREQIGYGRGGEFRVCQQLDTWSHFEYRTPSPWAMNHPMWSWWLQTSVRHVMDAGRTSDAQIRTLVEGLPERSEILEAINRCDNGTAETLWEASRVVWMDTMYPNASFGCSEHTGLGPKNLQYVWLALRNGGHTFYEIGKMSTNWFKNNVDGLYKFVYPNGPLGSMMKVKYGLERYAYPMRYGRDVKNRKNNTRHDGGNQRYFPSGPHHVLNTKYANMYKLPAL